MANVITYTENVRIILNRVAENLRKIAKPEVETLLIENITQDVFLLFRVGWHGGSRVSNIVIFARIRDSKVWIEQDNTDLSFADELLQAGIPREDIVLAFQPPERRHLTEFAVA
jgi:hypothetical protein